jgi:hypothetical protein
MATRIKFVNKVKPSEAHAITKQKQPRATPAPVAQERPRRANPDRPLESHRAAPDDDDARQTYEECRKAFNELAALHSSAQTEAADALRRLDKTEQELRRAREQSTGYAAQIAAQELEMRRVKEGKRAVEELNTRLSSTVSGTGGKGGDAKLAAAHRAVTAERDRLKSAHRAASEELEQLRSEHRDAMEERTKATEYKAFCDDMMQTVDKAGELCARACEPHAPDTARDMRETGETLRALRQATLRV